MQITDLFTQITEKRTLCFKPSNGGGGGGGGGMGGMGGSPCRMSILTKGRVAVSN